MHTLFLFSVPNRFATSIAAAPEGPTKSPSTRGRLSACGSDSSASGGSGEKEKVVIGITGQKLDRDVWQVHGTELILFMIPTKK